MTRAEMQARGWDRLDVLLVSGDAYIDHPAFGVAVIARVLEAEGFRVGVLAQPDWTRPEAFSVLGRPRLFAGVTAGNLDSLVANYTAARRKRRNDAYSEGGAPGRRPNYATVVYSQMLRRVFPGLPIVLGGIEASMRRLAHYDYWQDKLRRSILLDAKADLLVYGMGESAIREVARRFREAPEAAPDLCGIPGTARAVGARAAGERDFSEAVRLPSYEEILAEPAQLIEATRLNEREQNPWCGRPLVQFHGARAVYVEPPAAPLDGEALDAVYALPFTRRPHPSLSRPVPAWEMIRDSITVVRGCPGGCTFCGLGFHQGRFLGSRTPGSVLEELAGLQRSLHFRGVVSDLGGPTANLYGCVNGYSKACRSCRRPSCLFPAVCPHFRIEESRYLALLRRVRERPGIRRVFVNSGIRMDVALRTPQFLRELVRHHVSGHLKVAPEHLSPPVLQRMRKPGPQVFLEFCDRFERETRAAGKEQYLVPYFISSFPGCDERDMAVVERFLRGTGWKPRQVQDFIPLPMTPAAAMYWTGLDYERKTPIHVARGLAERRRQLQALHWAERRRRKPGKHAAPEEFFED